MERDLDKEFNNLPFFGVVVVVVFLISFINCNEHPVYEVLLFHLNSLPLLL